MIWKYLVEFAMAMGCFPPFGVPAETSAPCLPSCAVGECVCPKDSPCHKEGCCKDGCKCQPVACPMTCPVGMPCALPPMMPGTPAATGKGIYQVCVKLDKHVCPTVVMAAEQASMQFVGHELPYCYNVTLNLREAADGCVKLQMQVNRRHLVGGDAPLCEYKGSKKIQPNTPTKVTLSGTDAEPTCATVTITPVGVMPATMIPPVACAPRPPDAADCVYPTVGWESCTYPPPPKLMPMPHGVAQAAPMHLPMVQDMHHIIREQGQAALAPMMNPPVIQNVMPAPMAYPTPVASLPEPLPLAPATVYPNPVIERCVVTVPAIACGSSAHVELVRCCHKSTIAVRCDGVSAKGVRMTLDKGACGSLTVAAGKKYVHVHGKKWKASADAVEITADGRVLLKGHVKLLSEKLGTCASVKADALCVQVKNGAFEKIVER